ncbi:MAG: pilus assembly protein [Alphaproteobacteria bacterium]|nr:pilus assembly protein [Reyranella sp.]MBL6852524.1 pilus assembly protein [Alphaproteobacteria bacterium]MBL6940489.1 pilus assembly protein [Alphaproteobacteria bacterium]
MSAVEFALILPVMLLLYLGGVEILEGIAVNRMVALTSATVTNLVSQYTTISAGSQMPDILNASAQVLTPYSSSNAIVIVSLVSIDSTGKATISWSQALHGSARSTGSSITVPAAMDTPNTTLIYGETTYSYTPVIDFLKIGTIKLYSSNYMYPRASTTINLAP